MKIRLATSLLLVVSILPAAADSRDLVMERLSHCYSIADSRQYLECFYAAAQPLRSELGLPPAPQAQTFTPLFARPALAGTSGAPPEKSIGGSTFGFLSNMLSVPTTKVALEQFGFKNARPGPGLNVDHINARMASYAIDRKTGFFTVTLDNGQAWAQIGDDDKGPGWSKPASFYSVVVEYGALGTFNMTVNDGAGRAYKVRRLR